MNDRTIVDIQKIKQTPTKKMAKGIEGTVMFFKN